jgi:hypothetical protein
MSKHPCPYDCPYEAPSKRQLESHLLFAHDAFSDDQNIIDAAIKNLTRIKDMVRWLLIRFPATRSNDKLLYEKILQYFGQSVIWDSTTQRIKPRNPEGWRMEEWLSFISYETVRRSRQSLQRKYPDLQASENVAQERKLKEIAYREHFAAEKMGDYTPNTYIPTSRD